MWKIRALALTSKTVPNYSNPTTEAKIIKNAWSGLVMAWVSTFLRRLRNAWVGNFSLTKVTLMAQISYWNSTSHNCTKSKKNPAKIPHMMRVVRFRVLPSKRPRWWCKGILIESTLWVSHHLTKSVNLSQCSITTTKMLKKPICFHLNNWLKLGIQLTIK